MFMCTCQWINLAINPSIYQSTHPFIHHSINPSVYVFIYPSIYQSKKGKNQSYLFTSSKEKTTFVIFLTWKFDVDSKSDIVLYLKCLTGPQKFVIMIRCKINFDMIWYSVIFVANLYLLIFVWSSDILNFVFMNVVILVFIKLII